MYACRFLHIGGGGTGQWIEVWIEALFVVDGENRQTRVVPLWEVINPIVTAKFELL